MAAATTRNSLRVCSLGWKSWASGQPGAANQSTRSWSLRNPPCSRPFWAAAVKAAPMAPADAPPSDRNR